jgi:hypothetical protein
MMRKLLLATALLCGLAVSADAQRPLEEITFADLTTPAQRNAYYVVLHQPCSVSHHLDGNDTVRDALIAGIIIRWNMMMPRLATSDDFIFMGLVCLAHPDFNIERMVMEAVRLRSEATK